jgi:hypothetical protein
MDTKATHVKLKDKHVDEPSIFSLGLTMLILFVLISLGQIALAGLTAMIVLNLAGKFTMVVTMSQHHIKSCKETCCLIGRAPGIILMADSQFLGLLYIYIYSQLGELLIPCQEFDFLLVKSI